MRRGNCQMRVQRPILQVSALVIAVPRGTRWIPPSDETSQVSSGEFQGRRYTAYLSAESVVVIVGEDERRYAMISIAHCVEAAVAALWMESPEEELYVG